MIPIIDGFNLSKSGPIDQRFVAADQTARLALTWLYKGLLCYQIDTNTYYKYTGTPNSNLVGDWTATLTTGATGAAGSVWYNGSGVPGGGLGIVGDYYLNTASGDVYQKTGVSTWTLITNIKGPTGASGIGSGDFASLYVVTGATPQGMISTDAVVTQFVTNGPNVGAVPVFGSNKITINSAGTYQLFLDCDITGVANKQYQVSFYINGTQVPSSLVTITVGTDVSKSIAVATVVNVPSVPVDIQLQCKSITAGTNNLTFTNGSWGIVGINLKGATGDKGNALIHTENDIALNDAKITTVQGGTWTTIAPYSASVISDSRSSLAVPAALTGSKVGHSISYNGTTWSDNGVWRGPVGAPGSTGATGAAGPAGAAGLIPFHLNAGSPVRLLGYTLGWYTYDIFASGANYVILDNGNAPGTVVTIYRTTPVVDGPVPGNGTFAGHTIFVEPGHALISYKGRYVTDIPVTSRSITLMMVASASGVDYWFVVGEDAYVDTSSGLLGVKPIVAPGFNPSNNLTISGGTTTIQIYPSFTYTASNFIVPKLEWAFGGYKGGSNATMSAEIQYSDDNTNWFNLKFNNMYLQANTPTYWFMTMVDNGAPPNVARWYRLKVSASGIYQPTVDADRMSYGVLRYP